MGNNLSYKKKICKLENCHELVFYDQNFNIISQSKKEYCPSHTCVTKGCTEPTFKGQNYWFQYCFVHKCETNECPNFAAISIFCETCFDKRIKKD